MTNPQNNPIILTVQDCGEEIKVTPYIDLYNIDDGTGIEMPGLTILLNYADGPFKGQKFSSLTAQAYFVEIRNCAYIELDCNPDCIEDFPKMYPQYFEDTNMASSYFGAYMPIWKFSDEFLNGCQNHEYYDIYSKCFDQYKAHEPIDWNPDEFDK